MMISLDMGNHGHGQDKKGISTLADNVMGCDRIKRIHMQERCRGVDPDYSTPSVTTDEMRSSALRKRRKEKKGR